MVKKGEIRGLKAGRYCQDKDGHCILDVYKTDTGTHIVSADLEYDIYYHWTIDENGKVVFFNVGSAFEIDAE